MNNNVNFGLNPRPNTERIGQRQPPISSTTTSQQKGGSASFETVLRQQIQEPQAITNLTFSGHALQRMQQRQITLGQNERQSICSAIDRARAKGARETLIISEKAAFVVSVLNSTVITVMDRENLKDNLFTQIDSAIVI